MLNKKHYLIKNNMQIIFKIKNNRNYKNNNKYFKISNNKKIIQ